MSWHTMTAAPPAYADVHTPNWLSHTQQGFVTQTRLFGGSRTTVETWGPASCSFRRISPRSYGPMAESGDYDPHFGLLTMWVTARGTV